MRAKILENFESGTSCLDKMSAERIEKFTVSLPWCYTFARDQDLKSVTFHGEGGEVDSEAIKDKLDELQDLMARMQNI